MRKLQFIVLWVVLLLSTFTWAADGNIHVYTMYDGVTIAISGTDVKSAIVVDMAKIKPSGYFSLQVTASGSGTAKIEYEISNDNVDRANQVSTWTTPGTASDIVTAQTAGTDVYSFSPMICRWLRLVTTETGGANTITITAILAVQ